jgi:transposase
MADQPCFAALNVSLEKTTICVMSLDGSILREAVVATGPEAIADCLAMHLERLERIGLEAGPLSEWLVRGLADRGITAVLMETRQVRAALSAMIVRTDRKDARGPARAIDPARQARARCREGRPSLSQADDRARCRRRHDVQGRDRPAGALPILKKGRGLLRPVNRHGIRTPFSG